MSINYTESDYTKKYKDQMTTLEGSKPATYESQYGQAVKDSMSKLLNREAFAYDVNEDALWQQAKDNYIQQGRMAMQDTMGQAAAMTGGYGNSYAQGVGQQAYQGYVQQLNDSIPEYYQMAMNAYNTEGDRLKEQYSLLADQENQDYNRFMDSWNLWNTEYQNAQNAYESGRSWDYGIAQDNATLAQAQVDYLLNKGITPNEELLAAAGYDQQYVNSFLQQMQGAGGEEAVSYSGGKVTNDDEDEDDAIDYSNMEFPGFGEIAETAQKMDSASASEYLTAAQQAGAITTQQRKSLGATLGL